MKVVMDKLEVRNFDIERYRGQDYDAGRMALTVAIIEDTAEVFLVPIDHDTRRVRIEELHDYLEAIGLGKVWSKTHTVFRATYCDFTNPF